MRSTSTYSDSVNDNDSGIDLNPMLDVVFILLIFFIVSAAFVKEKVIQHNPSPANLPTTLSSSQPTVIRVESDDSIYIDERSVDINSVRALVAQKQAAEDNAGIVVKAHYQSSAKTYVSIVDAARMANVENVTLATFAD